MMISIEIGWYVLTMPNFCSIVCLLPQLFWPHQNTDGMKLISLIGTALLFGIRSLEKLPARIFIRSADHQRILY